MARLARRDLLRAVVILAGPRVLTACGDDGRVAAPALDCFPQSVASGDPRPESVVLWTRAIDPTNLDADQTLELVVATDPGLSERVELAGAPALELVATADAGGCVKVRVDGLTPGTTYYYRFTLLRGSERFPSRVGRTRTAPDPEGDAVVTFAVVSCQDYGGRYYHVYRHLAEQSPDFVLHLGDYVYETVGDPSFQTSTPERDVSFSDPGSALAVDGGGFLAARSLGNYRDLYRTYRSDPDLQRVHEQFPIIAIPDDHEFSNDCYGANATYTNDREDEEDFARRRAADRAWFEFMPVDFDVPPASALDETGSFPDDFRLYRRFLFGRTLELVITDLRRYRPDHVVPENAYPGAVFLSAAEATQTLGGVPDDAVPYVDIDDASYGDVRDLLTAIAPAQGFGAEGIQGLLSVPWINELAAAAGVDAPLDETDPELERGYAYHQLLKTAEYSAQGARYLLAEKPFRALAARRFAETDGASERLMGETQRAWFTDTLAASTRTWKVWGNEYTLMPRVIDLGPVDLAPAEFRQRLLLNAEDWDGAPNERNGLLGDLAAVENLVVVTGDLHAFFAGLPQAEGRPETRVVELVAGSVTSTTWLDGLREAIASDPGIPPEVALIAELVGDLLTSRQTKPNPHLAWLDLAQNGYAMVSADGETLEATAYAIDPKLVALRPSALPKPIDDLFAATHFRVVAGSRGLEQRQGSVWKRWDPESTSWV
jgi:alkaline phosphatase D